MKIAVLGSGPIALHTALKASNLGASVTLFAPSNASGRIARLASSWPDYPLGNWEGLTTEEARAVSGLPWKSGALRASEYKEYLAALWEHLAREGVSIKPNRAKRVHKRFLGPGEAPLEASRFFDLFRVVYSLRADAQMRELERDNPEMAQTIKGSLSQKDWQALSAEAEGFEDFDAVFEATGNYQAPNSAGPGTSLALNEAYVAKEGGLTYGLNALEKIWNLCQSENLKGDYVIVGSGELAAMGFYQLASKLSADSTLTLVTTELEPFENLKRDNHPIITLLEPKLIEEAGAFEAAAREYERALHEYRALEPHVRAKTTEPSAPKRRLRLWAGANITSLDRLSDRAEIFVTTELPAFRFEPKKEGERMMTIACKELFVLSGHEKTELYSIDNDVGYYRLENFKDIEESFARLLENFSRAAQ